MVEKEVLAENQVNIVSKEQKKLILEKTLTEEHKKKVSQQVSQRRWWNNGEVDKHTIECPGDGWVLGRPGHLLN